MKLRCALSLLATLTIVSGSANAQSMSICGDIANAFGPFDFRTVRGQELRLVESAHFPPSVEALLHGKHGPKTPVGGDIDYTLRAFPNHHRALLAATRFGERTKMDPPPGMRYTVECWYDRAVRFKPDDPIVRMLFARYLQAKGRHAEAISHLESADKAAGDNAFTHYNIGLFYLELGEPERALAQAHIAMQLGMTRTELKERLQALGKWSEPAPGSEAPVAPAGAQSQSAVGTETSRSAGGTN